MIAPTQRKVAGVRTRRARRSPLEATTRHAIPITTVARTLVDLAAEIGEDKLARACHEAGVRFGTTPAQVEAVLARHPNAKGVVTLRKVLRGEVQVVLSGLERRFLALVRDAHLPLPLTNRAAGGRRVDCRWPEQRLTVELDSYSFHNSRYSWEQDRRREREAHARGDRLRRYTHDDVFARPASVVAELRPLLAP